VSKGKREDVDMRYSNEILLIVERSALLNLMLVLRDVHVPDINFFCFWSLTDRYTTSSHR